MTEVQILLENVRKTLEKSAGGERLPNSIKPPGEVDIPAYVEIEVVSPMSALGHFYPAVGTGSLLSLEAVYEALERLNITNGVLHPRIKSAVQKVNLDRKVLSGIEIAVGTDAVAPVPEHWELQRELFERRQKLDETILSVDFKEQSPFVMVKEGDILGLLVDEKSGFDGRDIFGNTIALQSSLRQLPVPGANVGVQGAVCRAETDGCFRWDPPVFQVDKVLVLGDVDYQTGNINFPGDIVLNGEVAAGFRIDAKGSLFSARSINVSIVQCGGDVIARQGLIGNGESFINAKGSIKAKFIENIEVQSAQSIEILSSCLNCELKSLDSIVLRDRSLLMGGKLLAQNGISVFQVGSERGTYAELAAGMNYEALDKVVELRDQSIHLVGLIKEVERRKKLSPAMAGDLDKAREKLRKEVAKLNELSQSWVDQIDKREEAKIVVRGTIFPGNLIEICHVSTVITKPLKRVVFSLDKKRGVIACAPI